MYSLPSMPIARKPSLQILLMVRVVSLPFRLRFEAETNNGSLSVVLPLVSRYSLMGLFISKISGGSDKAILMPFTSVGLGTVYVNIYSATTAAVSDYGFVLNMLVWSNS